ncbi:Prp11 [Kluyveromyces lactis]|nr:Prp11 [Kluyveromyces lactis]
MDYQNRAGSKKGSGGIASDSQQNLQRRKQVQDLLSNGQDIPFSFQQDQEGSKLRANPDIYKNHSGKLVCKLCNTLHVSWSSVERHLTGKKHQLNVLRRGGRNGQLKRNTDNVRDRNFQHKVDNFRASLQKNGVKPEVKIVKVRHPEKELFGIAVKVRYGKEQQINSAEKDEFAPYLRIVSDFELDKPDPKNVKYLVVAFEPFENVGIQIPSDEIELNDYDPSDSLALDELNRKCTYWDQDNGDFYVQLFFRHD